MITTFYPPLHFGGDAIYLHRLVNALAERGHSVDVVHSADAFRLLSSQPEASGYAQHSGVRVHRLESRAGPLELLATQQTGRPWLHARALRAILGDSSVDVIHYHNVSLMGAPSILRLGSALKLYTLHEHWLVCPMHILWRYDREICSKRTCIRCQLRGRRPPQLWRFTRTLPAAARSIDVFVAPSRFTLEKHRELGFQAPMYHLPHFVPTPPAPPERRERPPRDFFLYAGRLEPEKGAGSLVRAFRRYRGADLVIVGDGSQRGALEREARGLGHVRFLGRLGPTELSRLYHMALAALMPSRVFEVFGLSVVEAFSFGTPAIVRNLGALPELIHESGGGLVYDTEDELIDGMMRIEQDPGLRAQLGACGRKAQGRLWSEEAHLGGYLELIEKLRDRRAGEPGSRLSRGGSQVSDC